MMSGSIRIFSASLCLWLAPAAIAQTFVEKSAPQVQQQIGHLSYSIPLPPLPTRDDMAPDLEFRYTQSLKDWGSGFGMGWALQASAIEILSDPGVPAQRYEERINQEDGDYKFRLALDGHRLAYVDTDIEKQLVRYTWERHGETVQVIRYDQEFSFDRRNLQGRLETITLPAGFEVIYPNGRKQIYSGDPAVAEGTPLPNVDPNAPLIERHFISKWPLVWDVQVGGESIQYEYTVNRGRSILTAVNFSGGRSRYLLSWQEREAGPTSHAMGYPQESRFQYNRLTACFDDQPQSTWIFAYHDQAAPGVSPPSCGENSKPTRIAETWARMRLLLTDAVMWVESAFDDPADSSSQGLQLAHIQRYGQTIDENDRLPTLSFNYSAWKRQDGAMVYEGSAFQGVTGFGVNGNSELLDINHDGLLDLIRYQEAKSSALRNEGLGFSTGSFASSQPFTLMKDGRAIVPRLNEGSGHSELYLRGDVNGDGWEDLVQINAMGAWTAFLQSNETSHAFVGVDKNVLVKGNGRETPLNIEKSLFEGGRGVFLDVNGDGRSDILHLTVGSDAKVQWVLYLNRTTNQDSRVRFERKTFTFPLAALDTGLLSESAYRFADTNGDGLVDFVRIVTMPDQQRGLCVHENLGKSSLSQGDLFQRATAVSGEPCARSQFLAVPDLENIEGRLNQMWVVDINSDGEQDFVDLGKDGRTLHYWLATHGRGGYASRQSILLNDRVQVDASNKFNTRVLDLDQDGSSEILVFELSSKKVKIIDFNRLSAEQQSLPSGLLHRIESDQGVVYRAAYASAHSELRREREADPEQRWQKTGQPFSDLLVKRLI
ncbi:MAG: hypothetical protein M3Q07_14060, partial [Pseudobdellovibrionaceae bacterium]|nr:hypothetical protein [Pseudobdellovibrionaceae bacterium]